MNLSPTRLLATIPNPRPERPPGTDGFTTLMNWLSWGAIMAGLATFLISLCVLAFGAISGRDMTGAKGLFVGIGVAILSMSAGTIMQVFV